MPRIIIYSDIYQRVGRKRLPYLASSLRTKQTIESPVRPAEPPRVGNLAQCPTALSGHESITDSALERIPPIPVVEFSAGRQKTRQSQCKRENPISSHIILPINLLFPGL